MAEQKGIKEGPPLFVESLLGNTEYHRMHKVYPNTYQSNTYRPSSHFTEGEYKWRWRMGESLYPDEIKIFNIALDKLAELHVS